MRFWLLWTIEPEGTFLATTRHIAYVNQRNRGLLVNLYK